MIRFLRAGVRTDRHGELDAEQKNAVSHRGKALRKDERYADRIRPLENILTKTRRRVWMKILIISDTHGKNTNLFRISGRNRQAGYADPPRRCGRQ